MEETVKLADFRRQAAPPAFTDIGYRLLGIDEWRRRCTMPLPGGNLHFWRSPMSDIGYWANIIKFRHGVFEKAPTRIFFGALVAMEHEIF